MWNRDEKKDESASKNQMTPLYYLSDTRRYVSTCFIVFEAIYVEQKRGLTIDRDIDDVKRQVQYEIDTIRNLMDSYDYRNSPQGWNRPFQLHRLRRALRIHYLALKIRETSPISSSTRELVWNLDPTEELW